jgi:hypothetical protein
MCCSNCDFIVHLFSCHTLDKLQLSNRLQRCHLSPRTISILTQEKKQREPSRKQRTIRFTSTHWHYILGLLLKPHNCSEVTKLLLKMSPPRTQLVGIAVGVGWGTRVDNNWSSLPMPLVQNSWKMSERNNSPATYLAAPLVTFYPPCIWNAVLTSFI